MKRLIAGLVASAMLLATPAAFAGDKWRGWHGGHGYHGGYRYHGHGHHKNNNNKSDEWAWALGGLLLGGIVAHGISQASTQPAVVESAPVYTPPYPSSSTGGRRLLRDLEGRCYDVGTDSYGNEIRTELPPSACNW